MSTYEINVVMPRRLTAENGAKALLMGEFFEEHECSYYDTDGELVEYTEKVPVSWDTIKEIYKKIFAQYGTTYENREREVQLLVKEVLSGSVQFYDNPNGPYEWTCPYCCAKLEGGYETILKGVYLDDLQHDHECAYIIAKGLKS